MIFAERAFLPEGWAGKVRISIVNGHIAAVTRNAAPQDGDVRISALLAAADLTGIGLTHLLVLYRYVGAGEQALSAGQLRFGNDVDRFARLVRATRTAAQALPADTRVGIAPHSLCATNPDVLARPLPIATGNPVHSHVAEQPKVVADISAWLRARPVEWLLANTPINMNWCAIHATHMTDASIAGLAHRSVSGHLGKGQAPESAFFNPMARNLMRNAADIFQRVVRY